MMSIFSSNSVLIWVTLIAVACVVLFIGMMFLMKKRVRISKTQRYYIFFSDWNYYRDRSDFAVDALHV